jgi:hypothetical protein
MNAFHRAALAAVAGTCCGLATAGSAEAHLEVSDLTLQVRALPGSTQAPSLAISGHSDAWAGFDIFDTTRPPEGGGESTNQPTPFAPISASGRGTGVGSSVAYTTTPTGGLLVADAFVMRPGWIEADAAADLEQGSVTISALTDFSVTAKVSESASVTDTNLASWAAFAVILGDYTSETFVSEIATTGSPDRLGNTVDQLFAFDYQNTTDHAVEMPFAVVGFTSAVETPVDEPTSLVLLLAGTAVLVVRSRTRLSLRRPAALRSEWAGSACL